MLVSFRENSYFSKIRSRVRSLKFALLLATGCIAAILIAELTVDGLEAWQKYNHVQTLRATNAVGNRLIDGIYSLVRERLTTNDALHENAPISADIRAQIYSRRKSSEDNISTSLRPIFSSEYANKKAIIEEIQN